MSFEINICSVTQKKVTIFRKDMNVTIKNERWYPYERRYYETWPFMTRTDGIFYYVGLESQTMPYTAIRLIGSDYDIYPETGPEVQWIPQDELENITQLFLKVFLKEDLKEIVETLLEASPEKTILFHTRYQSPDYENIQGVIPYSVFWEKLDEAEFYFNTCYIVRKDEKILENMKSQEQDKKIYPKPQITIIEMGQQEKNEEANELKHFVLKEENSSADDSIWRFIQSVQGTRYRFETKEEEIQFQPIPQEEQQYIPPWITEQERRDELHKIIFSKACQEELSRFIRERIEKSPEKTVLFQVSEGKSCYENIQGVIALDDFLTLLAEDKLHSNVNYLIRTKVRIWVDYPHEWIVE